MIKIIVAFFLGLFLGITSKDSKETSDKMWITEKCGTNTPPTCCPKHPAHIGYVDEVSKDMEDIDKLWNKYKNETFAKDFDKLLEKYKNEM